MKADWIEIKRGDILPQYAGIYASLSRKGTIVIGRGTHEMLGAPAAFLLLYDKANNRIGLKPAALSTRNAYPAGGTNRSGAKRIHAHRLLREHRITLPHTLQFDEAEIDDDGILVLDLRSARPSLRALAGVEREKQRQAAREVNLTTDN
jgi:hypothetical protein